jgi:hypothetical protein
MIHPFIEVLRGPHVAFCFCEMSELHGLPMGTEDPAAQYVDFRTSQNVLSTVEQLSYERIPNGLLFIVER